MDKLKMQTANKADENFKKLAAMFPNAVTETIDETTGEVVRAIDKDVLMQEINTHVVDGKEERYQFTWPDKKKSVLLANSPIAETLRPCRDESVDFDNTENLYIEGDNLDVLKLLQETYLGKVKMIYIDPPYNTGNDFVYNDDFSESIDDFLDRSGQFDEDGNRLFHNTESNGRFHTDWLNMIYPRLKIARNLLSDDGVIFISIDDNEQENLKKICDEILGAQNFVAQVIWERAFSPINLMKHFSPSHDYILCYAKNIELAICNVYHGVKKQTIDTLILTMTHEAFGVQATYQQVQLFKKMYILSLHPLGVWQSLQLVAAGGSPKMHFWRDSMTIEFGLVQTEMVFRE